MKDRILTPLSLLRLHRLCMVVAILSAKDSSTTKALQFNPAGWPIRSTLRTRTTTSSTVLAMTATRRKTTKTAAPKSNNNNNNKKKTTKKRSQTAPPTNTATTTTNTRSKPNNNNNILEDGEGHINPDLAANLWNWEQQHRENAKLPKLSFSTRQGLRLVDEIVNEMATSPRGQKLMRRGGGSNSNSYDDIRTDLVQEGVMALMDALNQYRQQQQQQQQSANDEDDNATTVDDDDDPNQHFELYARPSLEDHLWSTLDRMSRPVQLPETELTVWRHIQRIRPQLQEELGGKAPTIEELATRLELPPQTLQLLLAARRASLSVESTVEIITPDSLEDKTTHFTDQDQWDAREGHLLANSNTIMGDGILNQQEVLVEEYQDEMYQYEGEDEMWIHQTQVAAPLREIIPDGGPTPDDKALSDMIRHDVGEFLTKTLTPQEVQVVRMSFGLDGGKQQLVWEEIALALDETATDVNQLMTVAEVKKLLKKALEKLRTAYRNNYVETYLEDDDFGEDTV